MSLLYYVPIVRDEKNKGPWTCASLFFVFVQQVNQTVTLYKLVGWLDQSIISQIKYILLSNCLSKGEMGELFALLILNLNSLVAYFYSILLVNEVLDSSKLLMYCIFLACIQSFKTLWIGIYHFICTNCTGCFSFCKVVQRALYFVILFSTFILCINNSCMLVFEVFKFFYLYCVCWYCGVEVLMQWHENLVQTVYYIPGRRESITISTIQSSLKWTLFKIHLNIIRVCINRIFKNSKNSRLVFYNMG